MKNLFFALILLSAFVSCKKRPEPQGEVAFDISQKIGNLPDALDEVGSKAIKTAWNNELKATGIPSEVETLEVVSLMSTGDANYRPSLCYALKAVTRDKKTTLTALLIVKNNKLYFDTDTPAIICSSNCTEPCEPGAVFKNGKIWLVCSGCADCVKTDFIL